MTSHAIIHRALQSMRSACLDDADELEAVANAVHAALFARPEAKLIRDIFASAPTPGTRIAVVASDGRRLDAVLTAAVALAEGS